MAAFLLNVAMARTLAVQRPQNAALKAIGIAAGAWLGSAMIGLSNQYFRFPILLYSLSAGVSATAAGIGLAAATRGAVFAVRRAVAIPPAEAMRPEPPARYDTSLAERAGVVDRLSHGTRIVLRTWSASRGAPSPP